MVRVLWGMSVLAPVSAFDRPQTCPYRTVSGWWRGVVPSAICQGVLCPAPDPQRSTW